MRRRMARATAMSAAIGFLLMPSPAGAGGGAHCPEPPPATEAGQVIITDNCFNPRDPQVGTGQTVRWDLKGVAPHTVTFEELSSGDVVGSFSARFNRPGSYPYQCLYHEGMLGVISVIGPALEGDPIQPLSELRAMSGGLISPVNVAQTEPAPAGSGDQAQKFELHIGLTGGVLIAAGLVLAALVSTAGTTIAVRMARR